MSITQIRAEYAALQKNISALQDQMRVQAKQLMHAEFKAFFEQYGDVVASISWTQYTPYFNDGEPCRFSVQDPSIWLWDDVNNENFDDDEGSKIYDEDDIKDLELRVESWNEYNRDPQAAVLKYQQNSINNHGYDPFMPDRSGYFGSRTAAQKMADWRPFYRPLDDLQEELEHARAFVAKHPTLCSDFSQLCTVIASIDPDVLQTMFGDHALVTVTRDAIETEEYSHD